MKATVIIAFMVCMSVKAGMIAESASALIQSDKPDENVSAANTELRYFSLLAGEGGKRLHMLLLRFDLTPNAGREIAQDVELSFALTWAEKAAEFGLYAVRQPWDERSVTWNTLVGEGANRTAVLGDALDVQTLGPDAGVRMIYHFTVLAELVRQWLVNPTSNNGVAIMGEEARVNHLFYNRNAWNKNARPTLNAEFIDHAPERPTNESPEDGAARVSVTPTRQASVFFDKDAGNTHGASWWRIGLDRACLSNVWEEKTSGGNPTAVSVPEQILDYSQLYFWRVSYRDNCGRWSEWSQGTGFATEEKPAARKAVEAAHEAAKQALANTGGNRRWLIVIGGISAVCAGAFVAVKMLTK